MKKLICTLLTVILAVTASIPVFADDTKEITPSSSQTSGSVPVSATVSDTQEGTYKVQLPAAIQLAFNAETYEYEAEYQVGVKGTVASGKQITVTPASSFTMKSATSNTEDTANVEQAITKWRRSAVENVAKGLSKTEYTTTGGKVTADLTKEETYNGTLTFTFGISTF